MHQPLSKPESSTAQANTGERFLPSLTRSITGLEHLHRYLLAATFCDGKAVLDVACGEGYGSFLLAQAARSVVAIDIDERSIELARAKYADRHNVRWIAADCTRLPLPDASVDVVVSFETIEHIQAQEAFLAEIRRVLRHDGILVMSSPNKSPYRALHGTNAFHVRELERTEFEALLRSHFAHVTMAEQQALLASVVEAPTPVRIHFELAAGEYRATDRLDSLSYSVAVASNAADAPALPQSMLLDTHFEGGAHRFHEHSAIYEARDPGIDRVIAEHAALTRQLEARSGPAPAATNALAEAIFERNRLAERLAQATRTLNQVGQDRAALQATLSALQSSWTLRTLALPRALFARLRTLLRPVAARASNRVRSAIDGTRRVPDATQPPVRFVASLARRLAWKGWLAARGLLPGQLRARFAIRRSGLFDARFYRTKYADLGDLGDSLCLTHYCLYGWREQREPSLRFESRAYLVANPDVAEKRFNPLLHYVLHGRREGRWQPMPEADAATGRTERRPAAVQHAGAEAEPTAGQPIAWTKSKTLVVDSRRDHWAGYTDFRQHVFRLRQQARRSASGGAPDLERVPHGSLDDAARDIGARLVLAAQPTVSIAIPVHGQIEVTLECLASIARHSKGSAYEVVVVDDASPAATADVLARVGNIRLVRQDEQAGFGATCNRAVEHCRAPIVVLLNSDTQAQPGWLAALCAPLADPDVGLVGPMLLFPDGVLQEAGGRLRADGSGEMVGLFENAAAPRFRRRRVVDYVSGACAAFRRQDFLSLGGFDPRFAPAYAEDADLCLKFATAGKHVVYEPAARVVHHLSKTTAATSQLAKLALAFEHQGVLQQKWAKRLAARNRVRLIAFYLPQFHPIAENDRWWGEGFTEWRNVAAARPRFDGHHQPRLPADLGFYDLRTPGIMRRQADLARRYGVHGFSFYYYRFGDRRVLSMPIDTVNADPEWTLPFCLTWANENWTRRWDGQEQDVLLRQTYTDSELDAMLGDFLASFRHPAYLRVGRAPVLLIYNPLALPDSKRILGRWREQCRAAGIESVYFVAVESFSLMRKDWDPTAHGFDATVEFPPHECGQPTNDVSGRDREFVGTVHDYRRMVEALATRELPAHKRFRCVAPGWDNTARRRNDPNVFVHSGPAEYQVWLEAAAHDTRAFHHGDERLLFVNAWNEWAEGTYLEPDLRYGHAFLEATRNALEADA